MHLRDALEFARLSSFIFLCFVFLHLTPLCVLLTHWPLMLKWKKIEVKCEMKCKRFRMNQKAFFRESNKVLSQLKHPWRVFLLSFFYSVLFFYHLACLKAWNFSDGNHAGLVEQVEFIDFHLLRFVRDHTLYALNESVSQRDSAAFQTASW